MAGVETVPQIGLGLGAEVAEVYQIASGLMAGVAEVLQIASGSIPGAAEASQIASGFAAGVAGNENRLAQTRRAARARSDQTRPRLAPQARHCSTVVIGDDGRVFNIQIYIPFGLSGVPKIP